MKCSGRWAEMIKELEEYNTHLKTKLGKWDYSLERWVKYNIDRASKGNQCLAHMHFA